MYITSLVNGLFFTSVSNKTSAFSGVLKAGLNGPNKLKFLAPIDLTNFFFCAEKKLAFLLKN